MCLFLFNEYLSSSVVQKEKEKKKAVVMKDQGQGWFHKRARPPDKDNATHKNTRLPEAQIANRN